MSFVAHAFHRVDAARRLMTVPGMGAEASGRLFFAKRLHEAAKAAERGGPRVDLDVLLEDVLTSLDGAAAAGARREADEARAYDKGGSGAYL